jgi:hypothetical protein
MGVKVTFLRADDETTTASAKTAASLEEAPRSPTVLVPKSAVRSENGQSVVFVRREDRVERRAVKVGGADGDKLEISAGVRSGEQVIAPVPPDLKDGALVAVK